MCVRGSEVPATCSRGHAIPSQVPDSAEQLAFMDYRVDAWAVEGEAL